MTTTCKDRGTPPTGTCSDISYTCISWYFAKLHVLTLQLNLPAFLLCLQRSEGTISRRGEPFTLLRLEDLATTNFAMVGDHLNFRFHLRNADHETVEVHERSDVLCSDVLQLQGARSRLVV